MAQAIRASLLASAQATTFEWRRVESVLTHRLRASVREAVCFADRLGVAEVVLVPSDERTDELRRDQSRLMPHAGELTRQPMRTRTRFHDHTTARYVRQRPQ